jgi:hypothetical protein
MSRFFGPAIKFIELCLGGSLILEAAQPSNIERHSWPLLYEELH